MAPHTRLNTEGEQAHDRSTDNDPWARFTSTLERYKVFWLVAFAFGGWLGVRVTEPLASVPALQRDQATFRIETTAKLDTMRDDQREMKEALKVFARILCAQTSASDRYKYDIDCRNLPITEKGGP